MVLPLSLQSVGAPVYQEPVHLFTTRVRSPQCIQKVYDTACQWVHIVTEKIAHLSGMPESASGLVPRLEALKAISIEFMANFSAVQHGNPLYVAFNSAKKVEGVALAYFSSIENAKIGYLATNPDNIPVPGMEDRSIRGSGTALVRHIAHDVLESASPNKNLSLLSKESAIPFYEKLGFTRIGMTNGMLLQENDLKKLVYNSGHHTMLTEDSMLDNNDHESGHVV